MVGVARETSGPYLKGWKILHVGTTMSFETGDRVRVSKGNHGWIFECITYKDTEPLFRMIEKGGKPK